MTTPNPRDALAAIVYRVNNPYYGDYDTHEATADAILAEGWRPPLPKADFRLMRSLLAGIIDGHFGDDYREQAEAAADEIISRGWLDKIGEVGPPEPVATTLRRIIRDLEEQAAGPQQHTHAGVALSQYADRLRGHPALDAATEAAAQQREARAEAEARPHDDEPVIGDVIKCQQCGRQTRSISRGCSVCGLGKPSSPHDDEDAERRADRHAEIVEAERSEEVHGG